MKKFLLMGLMFSSLVMADDCKPVSEILLPNPQVERAKLSWAQTKLILFRGIKNLESTQKMVTVVSMMNANLFIEEKEKIKAYGLDIQSQPYSKRSLEGRLSVIAKLQEVGKMFSESLRSDGHKIDFTLVSGEGVVFRLSTDIGSFFLILDTEGSYELRPINDENDRPQTVSVDPSRLFPASWELPTDNQWASKLPKFEVEVSLRGNLTDTKVELLTVYGPKRVASLDPLIPVAAYLKDQYPKLGADIFCTGLTDSSQKTERDLSLTN